MSVRFDATGDYLTRNTSPASTFTVTAWVYVSVDTNDFATIGRLHTAGTGGSTAATWATSVDGLGGPNYFSTAASAQNSTGMAVGEWRKVAISRNGSTGKSYVNTVGGTTEVDSAAVATTTAAGMTFGARGPDDTSERFNGRIAYVRVWDVELTQAEIEAEWASATPVKTANLWAAWPLTSHTNLADTSGNGRNLTAAGTLTTEADPPISSTITRTIGQATETSSATTVARTKTRAVGQATETSSATTVARRKTRAVGQVVEQALAQALARVKTWATGQAVETSSATALARVKTSATGQAVETSSATALARAKVRPVGTAVEVDTSGAITVDRGQLIVPIGQALDVEVALPLGRAKAVPLGQAEELTNARPFGRVKTRTVAAAVELSTAAAVTARHITRRTIGQAVEDALAGAWTRRKLRGLGQATEHDAAGGIRNSAEAIPPTVLTAGHAPTSTLVAADGGRSRLVVRHD